MTRKYYDVKITACARRKNYICMLQLGFLLFRKLNYFFSELANLQEFVG